MDFEFISEDQNSMKFKGSSFKAVETNNITCDGCDLMNKNCPPESYCFSDSRKDKKNINWKIVIAANN